MKHARPWLRWGMAASLLLAALAACRTTPSANTPPATQNRTVTTQEDTPVAITLTATDSDGDDNAGFAIGGNQLRSAATFDYESRNSYRPEASWNVDGLMDGFVFSAPATAFCGIQFTMATHGLPAELQVVRVRIYDLGGGGIAGLGDFGAETPVFDRTFSVGGGTLTLTDTGSNILTFDIVRFDAALATATDLGAGNYALHLSFPNWSSVEAGWLSAPQSGGTECTHAWGSTYPKAVNVCSLVSPTAQNVDFRFFDF